MRKTFAITAMGGSGTKFLSSMMDKSEEWNVLHEPDLSADYMDAKFCQGRFTFNDKYGEVNSYLRFCFEELNVSQKGVIHRPINQIYTSWWSQKREQIDGKFYYNLDISLKLLDAIFENPKIAIISFNRMVEDVDYLNETIRFFGIKDVEITEEDLDQKINPHRKDGDAWRHIPKEHKEQFMSIAAWYIQKWDNPKNPMYVQPT